MMCRWCLLALLTCCEIWVYQDMPSSGEALRFNARHTSSAAARRASGTFAAALNAQGRNPTLSPYQETDSVLVSPSCHAMAVWSRRRDEEKWQPNASTLMQLFRICTHADAVTPAEDLPACSQDSIKTFHVHVAFAVNCVLRRLA